MHMLLPLQAGAIRYFSLLRGALTHRSVRQGLQSGELVWVDFGVLLTTPLNVTPN